MSAKIDTRAEVPGLGTSIHDLRYLATLTLSALGVNTLADNGAPTLESIYDHSLLELGADLRSLGEPLLDGENEALQRVGAAIMRLHDRLDLIQEGAAVLAQIVRAESVAAE